MVDALGAEVKRKYGFSNKTHVPFSFLVGDDGNSTSYGKMHEIQDMINDRKGKTKSKARVRER